MAAANMVTLKKRTYLDKNGKATTSAKKGRVLLGPEGGQITKVQAKAVGLRQDKAVHGPEEDK